MLFARKLVLCLFLAAIPIAACSRDVPGAPSIADSASAQAQALDVPHDASSEVFSSALVVVLRASGGIPNLDTTFTVERNGIIRVDEKMGWGTLADGGQEWRSLEKEGKSHHAGSVPVVDLGKLYELLASPDLKSLPPETGTAGIQATDYALSIDGGRRTYLAHGLPNDGNALRAVIDETRRLATTMTEPKISLDAGPHKTKKPQ